MKIRYLRHVFCLKVLAMHNELRNDIAALISLYEKTKREYDDISVKLRPSEEKTAEYRKQIIELERQIDNLKLKNAFLSPSGDEDAKEKIDRLIREIDKCIALIKG